MDVRRAIGAVIENMDLLVEDLPRHIAPGGIKRLVVGFACGLTAGALIALVLPRDDSSRRPTRHSGADDGRAASVKTKLHRIFRSSGADPG